MPMADAAHKAGGGQLRSGAWKRRRLWVTRRVGRRRRRQRRCNPAAPTLAPCGLCLRPGAGAWIAWNGLHSRQAPYLREDSGAGAARTGPVPRAASARAGWRGQPAGCTARGQCPRPGTDGRQATSDDRQGHTGARTNRATSSAAVPLAPARATRLSDPPHCPVADTLPWGGRSRGESQRPKARGRTMGGRTASQCRAVRVWIMRKNLAAPRLCAAAAHEQGRCTAGARAAVMPSRVR